MIIFNEKSVDDQAMLDRANEAFYEAASNIYSDDIEGYKKTFRDYDIKDLNTALARISYSKNFEVEDLFYFDQSSNFHLYVTLYIYVYNEDDDKESVCAYTLMLDEQFEVLDDFIH